jgi:hypothetical protein
VPQDLRDARRPVLPGAHREAIPGATGMGVSNDGRATPSRHTLRRRLCGDHDGRTSVIRTPNRGTVAGAALGTVGLAVGVLGSSPAAAAVKPVETAQAVAGVSEGAAATTHEIAAERRSLNAAAAALAKVAGATATAPPKAKRRAPSRPVAKAKPRNLTPRETAKQLVLSHKGWTEAQFNCLDRLWNKESGWDPHNENGGSGAYGIPQSLPGRKMAQFGSDWRDNALTQIRWGLWYITERYSTPCGAWGHSQRYNWY